MWRARQPGRPRSRLARLVDLALAVAVLALLALVAGRWNGQGTGAITGFSVVLDGDTLLLGDERLRLRGIDAPELDQTCVRGGEDHPCGREAKAELMRMTGGRAVACEIFGLDQYRRLLAECRAGELDLNREMVERGWAVAYGGYGEAEQDAIVARRGLWAGEFDRPEDWRRDHAGQDPANGIWRWLRGLFGSQGGDRKER